MTMKVWGRLALLCALSLVGGQALAQDSLTISSASSFQTETMTVSMTSSDDVQGYVLAIGYDSSKLSISNIDVSATVAGVGAELVVAEDFPVDGGFTLGVVLDANSPFDGQVIAAGTVDVANFDATPTVAGPDSTNLTFVDDTFNSPTLSNILVQNGLSIGAAQGLALNGGTFTIEEIPPGDLTIESTTDGSDGLEPVRVLLTNGVDVQGLALAIAHPAGLPLVDIQRGAATTDADFFEKNTAPVGGTGGTVGIVMDFVAPFDGAVVPAGSDNEVAIYVYDCPTVTSETAPDPASTFDLTFVDGVLGSPALNNVLVINGLSINPVLNDGTLTCEAILPPPAVQFICEGFDGEPGDTGSICFYYTSEEFNIQGFQLSVCFDCNLTFGDDFSLENGIADAVGAEYVNFSVDNDPLDGDGCEFVAGILLDALPPFEGQTVPQSTTPLLLGCISATIADDPALCGTSLTVEFCNGANGTGSQPIENIAVVDFTSFQEVQFIDCQVNVVPTPTFRRGDCNDDDKVDLADSAAIIGENFLGYDPACDDACDANDDGKINLADAIFVLNYKFKDGAEPPAPGPDADGSDPTDDALGCDTAECPTL